MKTDRPGPHAGPARIQLVRFLAVIPVIDLELSFWFDPHGHEHLTAARPVWEDKPDELSPRTLLYTHADALDERELLAAVEWDGDRVYLRTLTRNFTVDLSELHDPDAVQAGKLVLKHMNYDGSFDLMIRRGPRKRKPR